jgi:hypothetical protein
MKPEEARFEEARQKVIGIDRQRLGIGTLSEKTVHAILKNYYEPDEDRQEIPIENYVADIYAGNEIIEIQTGQFQRLRNKLAAFLPLYKVTVVYPIPKEKWVIWMDVESGELRPKRKSPKKGSPYTAFPELYKIKAFLKDPNLRLKLVLLDVEEYRLLNGWSKDRKKGSVRYDRVPLNLVREVEIERLEDYMQFLPYKREEIFTTKDFAKTARIPVPLASVVMNLLHYVGAAERTGKRGREYLYRATRDV